MPKNKSKKAKVMALILGVIVLPCVAVLLLVHFYLSKINIIDDKSINTVVSADQIQIIDLKTKEISSESKFPLKKSESMQDNIDNNTANLIVSNLYQNNVINIMLVGCDLRNIGDTSRADTIILLSINKVTNKITVTSFMRDIYLKIPGYGYNRINAAFAYGGVQLVLDTIERNFNIKVDKYVEVNFYTFTDLVDALGGVTVNVDEDDISNINDSIYEQNHYLKLDKNNDIIKSGGIMHLDGKQALGYVRNRGYANGDFTRTENQRAVVSQLCSTIFKLSFNEANNILCTYLPKITTNLSETELFSLLLCVKGFENYQISQICIPTKDSFSYVTISEMSVLQIDFEKNLKELSNTIYGTTDTE